jgi:hypothetical protein
MWENYYEHPVVTDCPEPYIQPPTSRYLEHERKKREEEARIMKDVSVGGKV